MGRSRILALWLVQIVGTSSALGQTVVRGPYLQLGMPTSIVVRWRTDVPTDSRVLFGSSALALGSSVFASAQVTEHVVTLAGLAPDTRYFYAVGSSSVTLAGEDSAHFFDTAPLPGTRKPTRIWVLGDSGTTTNDSRKVRDSYYAFTGVRHTDLWLMLGDNAYATGTDAEFQNAVFQNKYEAMLRKSVLWPTLGNHDGQTADSATQTGPYYDIFTLPVGGEAGGVPSGTEAYYSFDYANVHFVCLDSYETSNAPGSPMLTWLAADLAATTQEWRVAFWHHPPYTKGSHDSDTDATLVAMRQNVLPVLEAHGVDLVLCGHSHSYERSPLIDGHYGPSSTFGPAFIVDGGDGQIASAGAYRKPVPNQSPNAGCVYVVAGSSGSVVTGTPLNHPAMIQSIALMGSLVLDVDGDQLDLRFLDKNGVPLDGFTMVKGPPTPVDRGHVLVPPGQSFKYHDLGLDLGAAWKDPAFDDTAWQSGPAPLGFGEPYVATAVSYGPDASNKFPTTYFRTTFPGSIDPAMMASLRLWVSYDDGFVAWLNGQEVARSPTLPAGSIAYATLATSHEAGIYEVFSVLPSLLAPGPNVLAIEIHQTSATSSDLVLDCVLDCDAFLPFLGPCAAGTAGPSGTPADVLLLQGSSGGAGRSIDVGLGAPLTIAVMPPPAAATAHFALFAILTTPGPGHAFTLPDPIGTMCFTPSVLVPAPGFLFVASSFFPDPAALLFASPAPWTYTVSPAVPIGFTAALQGAILDVTTAFRLTNAVRMNVVP